jgi:hypothetical protein
MIFRISSFFLLILFAFGVTSAKSGPVPGPATNQSFQFPLSDGTIVQARCLPINATTLYLVYATRTGNLGLWTITTTEEIDPLPPDPTPDPVTDILSIAVVEDPLDSSIDEVSVLADPGWRGYAAANHIFYGIIPPTVVDFRTKQPPPAIAPFLEAAKGQDLPFVVMFFSDGTLYWKGHLPATPSDLIELIRKKTGAKNNDSNHHPKRLDETSHRSEHEGKINSPSTLFRLLHTEHLTYAWCDNRALAGVASHHPTRGMAGLDPRRVWFLSSRHEGGSIARPRSGLNEQVLGSRFCESIRAPSIISTEQANSVKPGFCCVSDRRDTRPRRVGRGCSRPDGQGRSLSSDDVAGGGIVSKKCASELEGCGSVLCAPEMDLRGLMGETDDPCNQTDSHCDSSDVVGASCLPNESTSRREGQGGDLDRQFLGRRLGRRWIGRVGRRIRQRSFGRLRSCSSVVLPDSRSGLIDVYFSPQGGCTEAIAKEIDDAQSTIRCQLYYFTSKTLASALRRAHDRGVTVVVILDKSQMTSLYSVADYLHNSGIPVWIDRAHKIAHNKLMIVDDATVVTGSFNWTKAAEEDHAENLLILREPSIVSEYLDNFATHLSHSARYTGHTSIYAPESGANYGE